MHLVVELEEEKMSGHVAPLLAEVSKIKEKIDNDAEVMDRIQLNQVKLKEQLKAEIVKNVTLTAKQHKLEETLASKDEIIKVLMSGADKNMFYSVLKMFKLTFYTV